MRSAGFLEKFLNGIDVEWKTLAETVNIQRGKRLVRSQLEESGSYAVYQNSMTPLGFYHESNVKADTAFIIGAGAAGEIGYSNTEFWAADDVYFFLPPDHISSKFLYHFLLTQQNKISAQVRRSSVPRLSRISVEKIKIPIPSPENQKKSLAIQTKIVHILDTFTAITSELTSELTTRIEQYKYYRDKLLDFEKKDVEWKRLGDVADFRRGTAITQKQTTTGDIPVIANGPTSTYSHGKSNREGETVVIARSGAYAGYVSFWNRPIFLTDAFSVHPHPSILTPKFVYHTLQNKQEHIHSMKNGAGVPHVRVKEFESYYIPIPSLAEQTRIVAILDKFDTLTQSITEGLPREIALRKQQYEYYRDLLLSFPKPDIPHG